MKIKFKKRQLDHFLDRFDGKDKGDILLLFYNLRSKVNLQYKHEKRMLADFQKAVLVLKRKGVTTAEIVERLSPDNLGDFYKGEANTWYPLDNSAKVYPMSMSHKWMAMFRMSCYLKENVSKELLQIALTFTIKRFPYFATNVKEGFFWHYLDGVKTRFEVSEENMRPCSGMKLYRASQIPFRVVYYKNRISVEYFHIITDGTGGLIFLKTLVAEYLRLLGAKIDSSTDVGTLDINDEPNEGEWADDFLKGDDVEGNVGLPSKPSLQFGGKLAKDAPYQVLHFETSASKLKEVAKSKNCTITALMLAYMALAGKKTLAKFNARMQFQVPANMRNFYESNTMRNFTMFGMVELEPREVTTLDELIPLISYALKRTTAKGELDAKMQSTTRLVKNIALLPMFIKSPVTKPIYGLLGDRVFTSTLSNVGMVKLPDGMGEYIEKMDFILGSSQVNREVCSMISCNDTAVLSIMKMTADPIFEEEMFKLFEADGMSVSVSGSSPYNYKTQKKREIEQVKIEKKLARKQEKSQLKQEKLELEKQAKIKAKEGEHGHKD